MTFLVRRGTPLYQAQRLPRALSATRDAELLVRSRWDAFLVADALSRRHACAAYGAALDEEAAASDALADLSASALPEAA